MPKSVLLKALCAGAAALLLHGHALAAAGATFISQSVPHTMQVGKTYSVSVTYKNTGTTKWTSGQYRLGALRPQDNGRWGSARVDLPPGVEVAPNAEYTFTFDVAVSDARSCDATANAQMRDCYFQWGLVQEYVQWLDSGASTLVELFNAPAVRSLAPPIAPPVTVDPAAFSAASFRGANVLMQTYEDNRLCDHTAWLPEGTDADAIIDHAVTMGLNVLRMAVILPPKTPGAPADWIPASSRYQNVCADPGKKEWGAETSSTVLTRGVITKVQSFMDKADAAGLKVILVLDGYTKYDANCYWKKSFLDVRDSADAFIKAFKSHHALLAWDIMNEPMWNALAFDCLHADSDYASVVRAVDSMYNLVRANDGVHPTTVGEAQLPLLKYWKDISSFASPHLYIAANSRDSASLEQVNFVESAALREMRREYGSAVPLVIGEFGSADPDENFNADYYQRFLDGLAVADHGFMLWSLSPSPNQQGYSVLTPDGQLKPAGKLVQRARWTPVVQQLYMAYLGFPADPAGLANFATQLDDLAADMRRRGLVLQPTMAAVLEAYRTEPVMRQMLDGLYASAPFKDRYTPDRTAAYVQQIYLNLFNRQPDVDGLLYWSDNLNYFGLEKAQAVAAIYVGGQGATSVQGKRDAATGSKKAALATAFTASLNTPQRRNCYAGNNAVTVGRALLTPVSADTDVSLYPSRVEAAVAELCGF
ncbi:cellulase family glycosylhydrolase [Duganella sp. FT135W]|uniref:Cellulase family glycosylhydrolase n=1 Tax=Duganella flavida TaxID=2692175 RepID=A0A6L8KAM0_9BURK|nr:cellulase family glycosylhydrolase [Duganella flavida]MYM22914.1 cellulase family glycosylhydrolase [Duganella flavida]